MNCPKCGCTEHTTEEWDQEFTHNGVSLWARAVPFYTCMHCDWVYPDAKFEAKQKDRAIEYHEGDKAMLLFLKQFKPCVFCGYEIHENLDDTFYPSGTWYREGRHGRQYVHHRDKQEGDKPIYSLNCAECSGGCGVEFRVDSKEEALAKWNRRPV